MKWPKKKKDPDPSDDDLTRPNNEPVSYDVAQYRAHLYAFVEFTFNYSRSSFSVGGHTTYAQIKLQENLTIPTLFGGN